MKKIKETENTKVALFEGKKVRKVWHNDEWWFVVNDAIEILTDSNDPAQYFKKLKERDKELAKLTDNGGVQFVPPLMLAVETLNNFLSLRQKRIGEVKKAVE